MFTAGHILNNIARIMSGGVFCIIAACSSGETDVKDDVIAHVDQHTLTFAELRKNLPGGLSADDSIRFVKAYVNEWVETRLISDIAAEYIDMTDINRLVEEYRNQLIVKEYLRRMFEAKADKIDDSQINEYYDKHKSEFILERPMVKGTYLKVPDDASNLKVLKKLYHSDKLADADKLEKEVIKSAIHYDYFRDRWVDWVQIDNKIPYDFGTNENQWLNKNRKLEVSLNGFTYLLYITEVLPAGSSMPVEAARQQIINRLLNSHRKEYEDQLKKDLLNEAKESGRIVINL